MSLLDPSPSGQTKWSGSLLSFSDPPTPVSLSPPNTDGWTETGWKLRPFIATCKGTIIVAVQSFLILWPHGLQHSRLPCPPLSPGVCSNSCPLSWWWHPTLSSSVAHFSSCSQSFPASGSFPMRQFFTSSGQSIGSSACIVSLSNEYSGLISFRNNSFDLLAVQGTLKSLLQHHNFKASILQCSAFFMVQLSYLFMTTGKAIALTTWTFVSKVLSLLFNMLSLFFHSFSSQE